MLSGALALAPDRRGIHYVVTLLQPGDGPFPRGNGVTRPFRLVGTIGIPQSCQGDYRQAEAEESVTAGSAPNSRNQGSWILQV